MEKPTYQDADVMLKMFELRNSMRLGEVFNWIWSDEFVQDYEEFKKKYPDGSDRQKDIGKLFTWFETLGTLYKHGLFNRELLFDWMYINRPWERVKNIAIGMREEYEIPRFLENFELMAKDNANMSE